MKTIGVIVGSLRKDAYSKKLAKELANNLTDEFEVKFLDLNGIDMYNQDFDDEGNVPESWKKFRKDASGVDAFLFVTPEYNRSMPAVIKNALDVGSRPYGQSVWDNKPGAVASVSMGTYGGFGANHALRQSLVFLNIPVMQQPELYLSNAPKLLDENGEFVADTKTFLKGFSDAFKNWINRLS